MKGKPVTHVDLLAAGISERRIHYWTVNGYLRTEGNDQPGSGVPRRWAKGELKVAQKMARLIDAGLTLPAAARVARGEDLGHGVRVVLRRVEA